jgi:hypothetical protein
MLISVKKLYRRTAVHQLMFAYVLGMTDTMPSITQKTAINEFKRRFNIEDFNTESLLTEFNRMLKEYQHD